MSQGLNPDSIARSMFDVLVQQVFRITEVVHHQEVTRRVLSKSIMAAPSLRSRA